MGAVCCASRSDKPSDNKDEKSLHSLYNSAEDILLFDVAYEKCDIESIVKLCNSQCQIERIEEPMHPWAADPATVGALAATQLAILASNEHNIELKEQIRECNGIQTLINLLSHKDVDKQHAAVVALSFLSVENNENCKLMFELGAMKPLIKMMDGNIDGLRAACAQTVRNIYVLDIRYRQEFVKMGGIQQLVKMLNTNHNDLSSSIFSQLEVIYHVEDLIFNGTEEISELVEAVKHSGMVEKLQALKQAAQPDLSEAASLVLLRLSD